MVNKIKAIEIKDYIGKKFYTRWYEVSQEAINKFADLTKDHQYIHINPERAEGSIYGKTVAHGFFTLSMLGCGWHCCTFLPMTAGVRLNIRSSCRL